MIQDIQPKKLYNQFRAGYEPKDNDYVMVFDEDALLVGIEETNGEGQKYFPTVADFPEDARENLKYLFAIDDELFLLMTDDSLTDASYSKGFEFVRLRDLRDKNSIPQEYAYAAFTAYQLSEWYKTTRFCGKCGAENVDDTKERARKCPKCGNMIYPRINPAVIIGVTDKETDRIILTKYRSGFGHNALVAGFTEIGETLEETVMREVMEEVGLKVTNIRYYKSQPWGIASDILAGFYCNVEGDKEITMDNSELKYAEWVKREDIILQPSNYSLTNEMMKLFKDHGYTGSEL